MSNDLVVSQNLGAGSVSPATGGLAGGNGGGGFASLPANAARKAEIERIMKSDFDTYDRDLRGEYLALLEAEQEEIRPDSISPLTPVRADDSRAALMALPEGRKLVDEWGNWFAPMLANVHGEVSAIVRDLGGKREQRAFLERFNRSVPKRAEVALMREIATGKPFAVPATEDDVKAFASTPEGGALVSEWGHTAADKVAVLRARADRLNASMFEDDAGEFWSYVDGLDTKTATAIFRRIAG